jgi:hypothetical protein
MHQTIGVHHIRSNFLPVSLEAAAEVFTENLRSAEASSNRSALFASLTQANDMTDLWL